jgi:hypothetical protein
MCGRMSKHWKPDAERVRWLPAESYAPPRNKSWPEGATAGLILVAAACLAVGALLYQVAGPPNPVEEDARR